MTKKEATHLRNLLIFLVGVAGIEPATLRVWGECSPAELNAQERDRLYINNILACQSMTSYLMLLQKKIYASRRMAWTAASA